MVIRQFVARWTGEFVRAHRKRLANLSLATFANGAVIAASLVALAFNTRGLGAAQFGILVVIQSYVALWAAICTLESWQTVCRLGAEEGADIEKICRRTIVLDIAASIVAFGLGVVGILLLGRLIGISEDHSHLAIVYAFTLLAGLAGTPKGYFRLIDRFDILAVNQLANAVLTVLGSAVLWYVGAGLAAYVYTFMAIGVVYRLQLFVQLLRRLPRRMARTPVAAPQDLSFARIARMSLAISILSAVINNRKNIALLTVSGVAGSVAAGIFAAALKGAAPLTKAADLTNQVIFSDVVRALRAPIVPPDKLRRLRRLSFAILVLLLALAGLGALLAEPLVRLVFDPSFMAVAPVLAVLLFVEALQIAGIVFNPAFQARGGTGVLTGLYATSIGVFVAGAVALGANLTPDRAAFLLLLVMGLCYLVQAALVLGPRSILAKPIRT